MFKYKCCFWCDLNHLFGCMDGVPGWPLTNLVLQWCETDEAQEEFSSWGHGHRGVHSCQAVCGPRQALPQAQDSFSWRGRDSLSTQLWFTRNTGDFTLTGITEWCWYEHTFVSLEEFKQSADCSYSRGHVWIFPHLRPEILHQLWPGVKGNTVTICGTNHKIWVEMGNLRQLTFVIHPETHNRV